MAFTINSAALPIVTFSSDFDKISYATESDSALSVNLTDGDSGDTFFTATCFPYNKTLTVYELDGVIELYMRQHSLSRLNLTLSLLQGGAVILSKITDVVYCPMRIVEDRAEFLAHHFLTIGGYKLSFQHSKEMLSAYVTAEESTAQYWTIVYRQSGGKAQTVTRTIDADTTAEESGIVSIEVDYDNLLPNLSDVEIQSVQLVMGARTFTLYYNTTAPLVAFLFINMFNAPEVEGISGTIKRKHETSHSEAVCNGDTTLYDITPSLTFEIETAPLIHVQARRLEELCKATDIWVYQGSLTPQEQQRVIITDYTSELSSQDDKMQSLKITFQFPSSARQDFPVGAQDYSRIFQSPYNPTYS